MPGVLPGQRSYLFYSDFLLLIKIKTQHISFFKMICFQAFQQLLFSAFVIHISSPDFHLADKLFSIIINNDIGTSFVAGLGFYIIIGRQAEN